MTFSENGEKFNLYLIDTLNGIRREKNMRRRAGMIGRVQSEMLQNKTDDPAWSFVYDATFDALLGISRSADLQTQNARIDTWMHTTKAMMRQHGA